MPSRAETLSIPGQIRAERLAKQEADRDRARAVKFNKESSAIVADLMEGRLVISDRFTRLKTSVVLTFSTDEVGPLRIILRRFASADEWHPGPPYRYGMEVPELGEFNFGAFEPPPASEAEVLRNFLKDIKAGLKTGRTVIGTPLATAKQFSIFIK